MCRGEGVERTESGSGTESYHLEGPSDGNCTVERRDAGVCVPSAYIYICSSLDEYTRAHGPAFII